MPSLHNQLLKEVDAMIAKHGPTHPELLKDLVEHRANLEDAKAKRDYGKWADHALRIASYIKFWFDNWG